MTDKKEVKITKLEIQLTDDKISLSTADAKKLYDALAELFAAKCVEVWHDYWTYRPYFYQTAAGSLGRTIYGGLQSSQQLGNPNLQNQCLASLSVQESTLQMAVSA